MALGWKTGRQAAVHVATKMYLVLFVVLAVGGAVNAHNTDDYSCAPSNLAEYAFREMTSGVTADLIPSQDQLSETIKSAPVEYQDLLKKQVGGSILIDGEQIPLSPLISRCCPKPTFNCTSVDIPLWYIRYYGSMCYIIYPLSVYTYKRCTCSSCLVSTDCPVVGVCVETMYKYVKVLAYCPNYYYNCFNNFCRLVKLLIAIPTQCQCTSRCPYVPPYLQPFRNASGALDSGNQTRSESSQ